MAESLTQAQLDELLNSANVSAKPAAPSQPAPVQPAPSQAASAQPAQNAGSNIDMLMDVSLNVTVELGRTKMALRQILDLQQGSVVELDRLAGEAVDIFVNDRPVAMGEVVVVDDKFGVRITELVSKQSK